MAAEESQGEYSGLVFSAVQADDTKEKTCHGSTPICLSSWVLVSQLSPLCAAYHEIFPENENTP
jgi:hypothetical protein